jgi:hypothetical protein
MSVDDTPDFDKTMDYTHISRTKTTVAGLRNEITELRNDISDLKNEIVESKNELDDNSFEKAKTPVLTPGSRNRVNPFLKDCEEDKEKMVDPLGALPVESHALSSQSVKDAEPAQVNGEVPLETSFGKYKCKNKRYFNKLQSKGLLLF